LGALVCSRSIILPLNPKDAGAYYNRGSVYDRKGDRDWATSDFDQAIRLNPNHRQVYNDRGKRCDNKGDYHRVISDANEAIRLDPRAPCAVA
jgi:lipoprotein NlpI